MAPSPIPPPSISASICSGLARSTESAFDGIKTSVDTLKAAGINVVYYESPGTAHEWLTWRRHLNELAPLLFR